MMLAPEESIPDNRDVLPAVRELISPHPRAAYCTPETVARLLWALSYVSRPVDSFEATVALEALSIEGEVAP